MADRPSVTVQYYPEIFDAPDMERDKKIILTEEGPGADTVTRWSMETPYLMELLCQELNLRSDMVVLDYGCGIGRMSKAMIGATGCSVIGLDISQNMRRLAVDYVSSDRFIVISPGQFDILVEAGLRVHAAIAIWVLQHCFAPADDIARIRRSLAVGSSAFVLNMPKRAIPAVLDDPDSGARFVWATDKIDVATLLRREFRVQAEGVPDRSRTPNMAAAGAYWMSLQQAGS